jgi:hypothetical protein
MEDDLHPDIAEQIQASGFELDEAKNQMNNAIDSIQSKLRFY